VDDEGDMLSGLAYVDDFIYIDEIGPTAVIGRWDVVASLGSVT
jgi:hypothetical protein